MGERPLQEVKPETGDTQFRLTYLPTFGFPKVIRGLIAKEAQSCLRFKLSLGAGGYDLGPLRVDALHFLHESEAEELRISFDRIGVFENGFPLILQSACMDGTRAFLEVQTATDFIVVTRHQCDLPTGDPFRDFVEFLDTLVSHTLILWPGEFEPLDEAGPQTIQLEDFNQDIER
jgi:hypothetical protein